MNYLPELIFDFFKFAFLTDYLAKTGKPDLV